MREIAFIDVETTGLDPTQHELLEVAAVRVDEQSLEVVAEAAVLVMPQHIETADPEALRVNGYAEPWGGRPLAEALLMVRPLLEGATLAGHCVAFDAAFLDAAWREAAVQPPKLADHHSIDTATLAWPLLRAGRIRSLSLRVVCEHLGISNNRAHSALVDARRSLEVARRILNSHR